MLLNFPKALSFETLSDPTMTSVASNEQKSNVADELQSQIERANATRKPTYYARNPRFNLLEIEKMKETIGQQDVNERMLQSQNDLIELPIDRRFTPRNIIRNPFQSCANTTVVPISRCTFGDLKVLHHSNFKKKGCAWTGNDIEFFMDGQSMESIIIGRLAQDQLSRATQPTPIHRGIYAPVYLYDNRALLQITLSDEIQIEIIIKMKIKSISVKKVHRAKLLNMHTMICLLPNGERLKNGIVFRRYMDEEYVGMFKQSEIQIRVQNGAVIRSHFKIQCGDSFHEFYS